MNIKYFDDLQIRIFTTHSLRLHTIHYSKKYISGKIKVVIILSKMVI